MTTAARPVTGTNDPTVRPSDIRSARIESAAGRQPTAMTATRPANSLIAKAPPNKAYAQVGRIPHDERIRILLPQRCTAFAVT